MKVRREDDRVGIDFRSTAASRRDQSPGDGADHPAVRLQPIRVPVALEETVCFRGQLCQSAIDTRLAAAYVPRRRGGVPWPIRLLPSEMTASSRTSNLRERSPPG